MFEVSRNKSIKISEAAIFEQLAEEAAELAQAASKVSRVLRGENPTPMTLEEAREHLTEEWTDLCVVINETDVMADPELYEKKKARWVRRIREAEVRKNVEDLKKWLAKDTDSHTEKQKASEPETAGFIRVSSTAECNIEELEKLLKFLYGQPDYGGLF